MAQYDTKIGRLHVERSQKENTIHFALENGAGGGFASVPLDERALLHAVSLLGAALALRGFARNERRIENAQRDAERRSRRAWQGFSSAMAGIGYGRKPRRGKHR